MKLTTFFALLVAIELSYGQKVEDTQNRCDPSCSETELCVMGKCWGKSADGAQCWVDIQCESGVCKDNICSPAVDRMQLFGLGRQFEGMLSLLQQCNPPCAFPQFCLLGFCIGRVPDGGACMIGLQCVSSICQNGVCVTPPEESEGKAAPRIHDPRERAVNRQFLGEDCFPKCNTSTHVCVMEQCMVDWTGLFVGCTTECDDRTFCFNGACVDKFADGDLCVANNICQSNHCNSMAICSP